MGRGGGGNIRDPKPQTLNPKIIMGSHRGSFVSLQGSGSEPRSEEDFGVPRPDIMRDI